MFASKYLFYFNKISALNGTARIEMICELLKHRMTLVHGHLGTQDCVYWAWDLQGWRPHSPSVPFSALTQEKLPYFLSTCPAVKTAVKSPPCWDVSFSISQHMRAPRPSHCAGFCWACFCFPFWCQSPQLDTAHQKQSHSNVRWKEIILCAHVTQKRSSVCGQVPETLVTIIRARSKHMCCWCC